MASIDSLWLANQRPSIAAGQLQTKRSTVVCDIRIYMLVLCDVLLLII